MKIAEPPSMMLDQTQIEQNILFSLQEDIGKMDITAALLPENQIVKAQIRINETAIICGIPWVNEVFRQVDSNVSLDWKVIDGDKVPAGMILTTLTGKVSSILTAERTALNWLQTLSATATSAAAFVKELTGLKTKLLDTRKTIPGLRYAQKYAVRVGGGENHRMGLYDAFLIKENHILSCGSITAAINTARRLYPDRFLEIEVENLNEFEEARLCHPDRIMLDNFSYPDLVTAVQRNQNRIPLEYSGNVNLTAVRKIAQTGVDYLSVGEITKNIQAIDLSLRLQGGF